MLNCKCDIIVSPLPKFRGHCRGEGRKAARARGWGQGEQSDLTGPVQARAHNSGG